MTIQINDEMVALIARERVGGENIFSSVNNY